jgi:phage tail-like protein
MAPVVQARNPLRNYQFRVGVITTGQAPTTTYVAGVKGVSGLRMQVNPWETWEGGNNLHRYANPNKVVWEPVTLEQGLALDDTFERWAQAVVDYSIGLPATAKEPIKRQVYIDLWDDFLYPSGPPTPAPPRGASAPGQPPNGREPISANPQVPIERTTALGPRFRRYHLQNAWISKYAPLPKLDSMTSEVALLSVELVHEGWFKEDIK